MGRHWSGTSSYHRLVSSYVNQTTTHGIRKITSSRHPARRVFWICVFLTSLGACCYHCSYLITMYASNPKVTITEEKDAEDIEFPSITVCNLNVIKKTFADQYFEMASNLKQRPKKNSSKLCFLSEQELAFKSAVDLSDTWLNLGVTKDNLSRYGHQASDLIIQCTYNSKECFANKSSFITVVTSVASPSFGLCHTIALRQNSTNEPIMVKKGGTTNGIRLTLNIEREEYWDLVSSEYGIRILVHPQGTYPTLQRGGIIVSPGRSIHIGITRKVSKRLPGTEGSCTESFKDSKVMLRLAELDLDFDVENIKYTYEYCNTLCQNAMLFDACGCLDEEPKLTNKSRWKFCNPCNKEESACRSSVLRNFSEAGNLCDDVCKPSCNSIRYKISLSKASWPNLNHQQFVMNRSRELWLKLPEAMGLLSLPFDDDNITAEYVNDTFFRENLLHAHLFIEEMIYMSIEERFSYTLPKLLADLGGCLGLYLGVSVISIIELVELFGNASLVCLCRFKNHSKVSSPFTRTRSGSKRQKRSRTGARTTGSFTSNIGRTFNFPRKKSQRNDTEVWRPPFHVIDSHYENGSIPRRSDRIRRF